ncbi:hypothetical protein IH980_04735 [Patescibacteria group bacterium]|nr:hypothetical protein [Patescibacteria group bacterium]
MKKKTVTFVFLIVLLSVPALRALSIPEFYTSHDGSTHTARIANYYLALKEGQIPPRLAPNLFGGLGYPIFIFIYPLPYLLGAAFHGIGFSFTQAFELVIGASFVLSAITMFLFAKEIFGALPGFVAAIFYSWAPYRFSQLYVRGAIAESFAYIFIPLVLLALWKLSKKAEARWIGIGSLSLAGLFLSHQLVSLMFLPVFFVFGLLFLKQARKKRTYLLAAGAVAVLGFATSAFIYFPALFERGYLHFDELIDYYADHFVTVRQLIHSPWSYGFSMRGTINDDMSFQVGLTHLLVAGLATVSILTLLWKHKKKATKTPYFWLGFSSLAIFSTSILLMLELPAVHWMWKNIPPIAVIDFPWRLLGVSVFSASLLASFLLATFPKKSILFGVLMFFVFYSNRNHLRINKTQVLSDEFFLTYAETASWRDEFLPRWRMTNQLQYIEKDFKIKEGKLTVEPLEVLTHRLSFRVEAQEQGRIGIHRLYFPGWKVALDGKPLTLGEEYEISGDIQLETETTPYVDRSGFIGVKLPLGTHTLEARFSETPLRKAGFTFSLVGLLLSVGLISQRKGKR